jgi:hypothetical protein
MRLTCVLLLGVLISTPAWPQQRGSAGLFGRVADVQDSSIPGAVVTLVHLATNQGRTVTSNDEGQYLFSLLPPGEYRLTIEKPGFKRFQAAGLLLQVNDNLKVDAKLDVGDVTTTVTVEALGVAVETSSAALKDTIDSKRVVELPLNGRNLADLALLVPGVQAATGVSGDVQNSSYSARGTKEFSVNGSRQNNLKFTLDGGDNQDNLFNANLPFPFPDAIQEFSVQTSNAGLEIGKSSGGAVNMVTKSGTNEFHGNAFWFIRNTALNANGYFSQQPDQLRRNQGGFTLGGPVIRNKLFAFGGYQRTWLRSLAGGSSSLTMPAPYRQGDFSNLLSRSTPLRIIDPLNGQPFPNNIIPTSRHSPAAQALLKFSPLPDPDGFTRYALASPEDTDEQIIRGDWRPHLQHSFVGRYFHQDFMNPRVMVPNNIHSQRRGISAYSKNATAGYTYVPGAALVADTHFTMSRVVGDRTMDFPQSIKDFGVNINPSSREIDVQINGTSGINLSTTRPAIFARTNFELTHSWRWVKGRHSLVWGTDLMWSRYNEYNVFNGSGVYRFDGRITGFDQADYILGALSLFRQSNGEIEFRRHHYQGFYGADTFRLTSRLTLNFGLRWEPYTPITDLKDRSMQFRPEEYAKGTTSPHFVNAPPGLFFPGDTLPGFTVPKAGTGSDLNNLSPRFGFAWDIRGDGSTSLRGGYGIFYDTPELWLLNNMNAQTPFSFLVQFQDGYFDEPYRGRQNFNVFPFAGDFDPNTPFQIPFDTTALESKFVQAYVQQWNLTLERKLANDWLFRVGYVGTKSTHLMADYDQNAPIYDFTKSLTENRNTIDARRRYRAYQRINTLFTGLNQIYNSGQISLNKRFSQGFSVLTSYTWSKNIDYNSRNNNVLDNLIPNPFDFFYTRGLADNDHPHRFVTSFVWNLPDPGKPSGSRVLSAILGDWQASGIVTVQSGRPFSIRSSGDRAAGAGSPYGDLIGDLHLDTGRPRGELIARYFNTAAADQPAPGTYGTIGRNVLRGPGYANTDLSISRRFPLRIRESANLWFRSEFFNLFNQVTLGLPGNQIGPTSFGRITSTDTDQRILQFSLKVEF